MYLQNNCLKSYVLTTAFYQHGRVGNGTTVMLRGRCKEVVSSGVKNSGEVNFG